MSRRTSWLSWQQALTHQRIKYVTPVAYGRAEGLVAAVYRQMGEEFAIVPPLTICSPVPEILAALWCGVNP
jgi:hypothetical protein